MVLRYLKSSLKTRTCVSRLVMWKSSMISLSSRHLCLPLTARFRGIMDTARHIYPTATATRLRPSICDPLPRRYRPLAALCSCPAAILHCPQPRWLLISSTPSHQDFPTYNSVCERLAIPIIQGPQRTSPILKHLYSTFIETGRNLYSPLAPKFWLVYSVRLNKAT